MYRGWRITVVVPAFNEARLLPRTLETLPRFVDDVVVVDDASSDRTLASARRAGPWRLEVIRHAYNQGVGGAIVTGYRRALTLGAQAAVVVGADAQMDPAEMSALLDALVDGHAGYAKGDRLGHPELWRRMPWVRVVGNLALSRLTALTTGLRHVRDSQCGYTAITSEALRVLPLDHVYRRYGFPNDLLSHLALAGVPVVDRPVTPIYATETSGIRLPRVVPALLWLLGRALARRLGARWAVPGTSSGPSGRVGALVRRT